jgi:lambda repressor-like predicted transcriptional regulator
MTVAQKIDNILKSKGMSRRQLAIKAKIAPSSLQSAMERGDDSFAIINIDLGH